jgi:hypothetical protein
MFERFNHVDDLRDRETERAMLANADPATKLRSYTMKRGTRTLRASVITDDGDIAELSVSSSVVLGAPNRCTDREVRHIAKVLGLKQADFGVRLFLRKGSPIRAWRIRL